MIHNNLEDLKGIVRVRNRIVHGYVETSNEITWDTIQKDLPRLIIELKNVKANNK